MSRLFDLIDAYRAEQGGMSEAAFARKAGLSTQTLNGWRNRGMVRPPAGDVLRRVAKAMERSYEQVVLPAVLMDLGWIESPSPPPPPPSPGMESRDTA